MDDWKFLASKSYPQNSYDHTNLVNGIKCHYKIHAVDVRGQISEFSENVSGVPVDIVAPKAPKGLEITNISYNSISFKWMPNTESDLEGYNIYRFTTAGVGNWGKLIGKTEPGNESFTDTGLKEQATYYYVITAFDEVPNESPQSSVISGLTLLGEHEPEVKEPLKDIVMDEDSVDGTTINLMDCFTDVNDDTLSFKVEGNENIEVIIYQNNGTVILIPKDNWHGQEILTFIASDGMFNTYDEVTITVNSVNDPPINAKIVEPEDGLKITPGELLDFSGSCTDADLPYDVLTYKWTSDIQGELGFGQTLTDIELVQGVHKIKLIVMDISGKRSVDVITISVLEVEPETEAETETEEDEGGVSTELFNFLIIFALIIVVFYLSLFVVALVRKRRRQKELEAKAAETSRLSFLSVRMSEDQRTRGPG
jgi:hypothetical protein